MTKEQHRKHHILLHNHLDDLVADFISHNPRTLPSKTSILELMRWAYNQTLEPSEDP